jgi:glycosyltransferase involved in cell wall biosynthesis
MNSLILYLGKRGGGSLLSKQVYEKIQNQQRFHFRFSKNNEEFQKFTHNVQNLILDDVETGFKAMVFLNKKRNFQKNLVYYIRKNKITNLVVLMAHPWDVGIEKLLKGTGVNCIRVIHDAKKHPGDNWPSNAMIRKLVKNANMVITLSEYVKSNITRFNSNIVVCDFPKFEHRANKSKTKNMDGFVIGIVGRSSRYKGVEKGLLACQEFRGGNVKISVIGQVAKNIHSQHLHLADRIVDSWLSPDEFIHEISQLDLILLPYTEASQSGIIPIAISLNKKIVVTKIGGLPEQIESYPNGIVCETSSVEDLTSGLDRAIRSELKPSHIRLNSRIPLDEYFTTNL